MGKINKNDVRIIIHRLYKRFLSSFFKFSNHRGIDIMKENWDYLIILDAARYDLFKESVKNFKIQGKLKKVESKGSATPEWLKKNFKKDFYDIIYVSANPFIKHKIDGDKIFYKTVDVFLNRWNKKYGTVMPDSVSYEALKYHKKYPNKKMIIHFIQPHLPYIGKNNLPPTYNLNKKETNKNAFNLARLGKVKKDDIIEAYKGNLNLALKEVKRLIKYLKGNIIITSDHGEMLGEKFLYGHCNRLYFKELTEVPWLTINKKTSKKIKKGELNRKGIDKKGYKTREKEIKEKLEALGYI